MNKRILVVLMCAAVILLVVLLGISVFGNPVAKMLAQRGAERYLEAAYPGEDFYIDRLQYNSKTGRYEAKIQSRSSVDSHFDVGIGKTGKVEFDTYESNVLSKWNTVNRICNEYSELAVPVLKTLNLKYTLEYTLATIEISPLEKNGNVPGFALRAEEIQIDGFYDIRELGKQAGVLTVGARDEHVSAEKAAEILLEMKKTMDNAGIPFYGICFSLSSPKADDGSEVQRKEINVELIRYEEICEDGFTDRLSSLAAVKDQ